MVKHEKLSWDHVSHLAQLSRLDLSAEELDRTASNLTQVVGYIDQLKELELGDVSGQPSLGVTGLTNILASDTPMPEDDLRKVDTMKIVTEAPLYEDRLFMVRAVFNNEQ